MLLQVYGNQVSISHTLCTALTLPKIDFLPETAWPSPVWYLSSVNLERLNPALALACPFRSNPETVTDSLGSEFYLGLRLTSIKPHWRERPKYESICIPLQLSRSFPEVKWGRRVQLQVKCREVTSGWVPVNIHCKGGESQA